MGLLLKAIRTLPESEQDAVLGYLLAREPATLPPAAGAAGPGLSFTALDWPRARAAHVLRRLADGAEIADIATEVQVAPESLRLALRDVARRSPESTRRAELFTAIAEAGSIASASRVLRSTKRDIAAELSPSEDLIRSLCATLMGRTTLPSLAAGTPRGPMKTVPVRFPEHQYDRLKRWCEGHDFPMAVVVRGLVEHFLDQQERRGA